MNWTTSFKTAVAVASVSVFAAVSPALGEEDAAAEKEAASADAGLDLPKQQPEKNFYPLLRCVRAEGSVQVQKPHSADWVDAEEGRYYPLGSVVRVLGAADATQAAPAAAFEFGEKSVVSVSNAAEFATREVAIGEPSRALVLKSGRVAVSVPRSLKEGLFKVVASSFECVNLAGDSLFDYAAEGDGDEVVLRCVTGTLAVNGGNFRIPRMGAANQLRIRTTGDSLFTSIRGESGDCKVMLDQGLVAVKDVVSGETTESAKELEFTLSPKCSVKIFRAKAAIGGRMSVSTMTFGATGEMLNRFVFAEGLSSVNSGELVVPKNALADDSKAKKAKAKSDAAEEDDAENVEAKPSAKSDDAEEKDEKDSKEKKEDE